MLEDKEDRRLLMPAGLFFMILGWVVAVVVDVLYRGIRFCLRLIGALV